MCGIEDNAALETMLGGSTDPEFTEATLVELEHAFWVAEKAAPNFRAKFVPCAAMLSLAMLLDTAE